MIQMNILNCGFTLEADGQGAASMNLMDQDSKILVTVPLPPDAVAAITGQFAKALNDDQKKMLAPLFETSKLVLPDRDFKFDKGPQG